MSRRNTTFVGRRLGGQLRRLREQAGVTVTELADARFMGRQKLWRMESGQGPYRLSDVSALCYRYGVPDERRIKLEELALKADQNGWWEPYDSDTEFGLYLETEQETEHLIVINEELINGLLQTREYHRGLNEINPSSSIEAQIKLRSERQERFWQRADAKLTIVMNELALVHQIGSQAEMAAQEEHLRDLAERPGVSLRYIPLGYGHRAMSGPFTVMVIDDEETIAYTENVDGGHWITDRRSVAAFYDIARHTIVDRSRDIRERRR